VSVRGLLVSVRGLVVSIRGSLVSVMGRAPPEVQNSRRILESGGFWRCILFFGGSSGRFNPRFIVLALFWILVLFTPENSFFEKQEERRTNASH